jgi:hypothetical protein
MSNLKVTNIQSNGTGFNDVVSFQNASGTENGILCRAWVNWNGQGTVAIRASFNVSSITDDATGKYTINFSNSMPDANYAMGMLCQEDTGGGVRTISGYSTRSASAMPVDTRNSGTQLADMEWNTVSFFR